MLIFGEFILGGKHIQWIILYMTFDTQFAEGKVLPYNMK